MRIWSGSPRQCRQVWGDAGGFIGARKRESLRTRLQSGSQMPFLLLMPQTFLQTMLYSSIMIFHFANSGHPWQLHMWENNIIKIETKENPNSLRGKKLYSPPTNSTCPKIILSKISSFSNFHFWTKYFLFSSYAGPKLWEHSGPFPVSLITGLTSKSRFFLQHLSFHSRGQFFPTSTGN